MMLASPQQPRFELGYYFTKGIRFRELVKEIHRMRPASLLVMGCGNGYLESLLSESIDTLSVDIDKEELAVAQTLNQGNPSRKFTVSDIYDLPNVVAPESFAAVVVSEVLEHLPDDVAALAVANHCLAPGGTLFVTVPNVQRLQNRPRCLLGLKPKYMALDHIREYTIKSISELAQRAGFQCRRVVGLDLWFPKDFLIRPVIPFGSPLRHWAASRWPTLATWHLLVCAKSESTRQF